MKAPSDEQALALAVEWLARSTREAARAHGQPPPVVNNTDCPGYVIVAGCRGGQPELTIYPAAELAAWYRRAEEWMRRHFLARLDDAMRETESRWFHNE